VLIKIEIVDPGLREGSARKTQDGCSPTAVNRVKILLATTIIAGATIGHVLESVPRTRTTCLVGVVNHVKLPIALIKTDIVDPGLREGNARKTQTICSPTAANRVKVIKVTRR